MSYRTRAEVIKEGIELIIQVPDRSKQASRYHPSKYKKQIHRPPTMHVLSSNRIYIMRLG
jgi:hypothetical protein